MTFPLTLLTPLPPPTHNTQVDGSASFRLVLVALSSHFLESCTASLQNSTRGRDKQDFLPSQCPQSGKEAPPRKNQERDEEEGGNDARWT